MLEGDGAQPVELPIHTEILKARPDVQSVLHSHMELKKLRSYYTRKSTKHGILPSEWNLVPSKER